MRKGIYYEMEGNSFEGLFENGNFIKKLDKEIKTKNVEEKKECKSNPYYI